MLLIMEVNSFRQALLSTPGNFGVFPDGNVARKLAKISQVSTREVTVGFHAGGGGRTGRELGGRAGRRLAGEGSGVRVWSSQPSLLQASRPGAPCGRRKVERLAANLAGGTPVNSTFLCGNAPKFP
jgi:hypothetical protein